MRAKGSLCAGVAAIALAPFLAATPAAAQDAAAPTASAEAEDDIVVTARRRDERLIDVPVAVTALSGETLEEYSVSRIADLATLVPSMVTGKAASGSSASIFLRGVGSTALSAGFDQSVSFVVDGLPMSRGREISLPQFDIQNVEVLRGPQALFFGKNTTGGLISVRSNNPTEQFSAGLRTGYGTEAREWYGEGFVSGALTDTLRARLALRLSDSEGAFTNTADASYPTPLPGLEMQRTSERRGFSSSQAGRLSLDWDPTPSFAVQLRLGATSVEDGGPTDIVERLCGGGRTVPFAANGIPPSPNADCSINGRSDSSGVPVEVANANYRYARDGKLYGDFASEYGVVTATADTNMFDVTSITGYYHFRQTDLNNVAGEGYPATFTQLADFEQYSQEVRVQSTFDGPLNVLFGGFFATGEFEFNTDAYIFPVPLDALANTYVTFKRDNGFETESTSLFAQATLNLSEQWELAAGGRYSWESRDSFQRSLPAHVAFAGAFPGGILLQDRYDDENFSPEVTLRFKPSDDTTWYVAFKEGFKAGGFNISQALSPLASVELGRFGAETARGGEVGLRTIAFDRSLRFNITAFHYLYEDLQVQFFDPTTVSLTAGNAGELLTQGIEADFSYSLPSVAGLSIRGAFGWNDVQYQDYVGQCYPGQTIAQGCNLLPSGGVFNGQDYDGLRPPKAPEYAARLGVTYETPISSSGMLLRVSGDAGYTSSYNFSDALRPDAVQDEFWKLDTAIALISADERWTLSLIGRNLTDEYVVTAGNDIPFAGGTGTGTAGPGVLADMSAFVDNPREVFVEFSWRY